MKYLRQGGEIFVLLFFALVVFGFSEKIALAEPTTDAECKAVTPNAGECRDDIGADSCAVGMLHKYGTCGTGKVCCIRSGSVGSSCEASGRTGSCKEKGGCNSSTEDDLGVGKDCQKGAPNLPDLTCCSLKSSSPNPDVTCNKLQCGNGITGTCMPTSPGCGDLKQYGSCLSNVQGGSVCCIPKDCTPTSTPSSPPSSGSASLNYTPLENLPGFEGQGGDFATYFKNLYLLAIWIVGISALFMLVVGGFLYLSSAGNTSLLGSAKKTIYGALIGLIIALISWLLLDTINSDLTNLKLSGLSSAVGGDGANKTGDGKPSTATGKTDKSGCEALNNNVVKNQCNLASEEIVKVLSCIESKVKLGKNVGGYQQYSFYSLASNGVGGDQNASAACCGNSGGGKCPHSNTSCHHGCDYGTKGLSYAVDIWTEGLSDDEICNLASIAKSCGSGAIWGPFTKCGIVSQPGHSNHLHVSTSGCNH